MKNEKTKRDDLLRKAQEIANNIIEEKRIHDELERRMKAFQKEKRDLLYEVSKFEKELQMQMELKKKLQNKVNEMRRKYIDSYVFFLFYTYLCKHMHDILLLLLF